MAANGNSSFLNNVDEENNQETSTLTFIDKNSNLHRAKNISKNSREHLKCEKQVEKACEKGVALKTFWSLLAAVKKAQGMKIESIFYTVLSKKISCGFLVFHGCDEYPLS